MSPRTLRSIAALVVLLAMSTFVACKAPSVQFVDSSASYTTEQTRLILERVDASLFAEEPTSQALESRRSALARLRAQGGEAATAADLITETFPPGTRSVPVYVELATVDGKSSVILVEAWGPSNGALEDKRLWVLDSSNGDVIYSAAAR
jgi:hypothetical protein